MIVSFKYLITSILRFNMVNTKLIPILVKPQLIAVNYLKQIFRLDS